MTELLGDPADLRTAFVDTLVNPLIDAFRLALDDHGVAAFDGRGELVAFETHAADAATGSATGRIVLLGPPPDDLDAAVAGLDACLDALVEAYPGDVREARALVDAALGRRLRFLQPETAGLLADGPFGRFAHHLGAEQDGVLRDILRRVREKARAHGRDPGLPRPVVVVDLDSCALSVRARTIRAATMVGAAHGVPELAKAEELAVLPADAEGAWANFVADADLAGRYPDLDWVALHREFRAHFWRPYDQLRTDVPVAGLAHFVTDVVAAGGEVVYDTGRGDRHRAHTEDVLRRYGVVGTLLTQPDAQRHVPTPVLKVERLRELGPVDVVAVIDDLAANRQAVRAAYPEAIPVAVEHRGFATERAAGATTIDGAVVITSFERLPVPDGAKSCTSLSYARSMNELRVGDLLLPAPSTPRVSAVHLDDHDSRRLVAQLAERAHDAARQAADRARRRAQREHRSGEDASAETSRLIWQVAVDKLFLRGSRTNLTQDEAVEKLSPFVRAGRPVQFGVIGFPVKFAGLKAHGSDADLAELGALLLLQQVTWAVEAVYPPGARVTILTDGTHFRPKPRQVVGAYQDRLRAYLGLLGARDRIRLTDIDHAAAARLGPDLPERRQDQLARHRDVISARLRDLDVTADPGGALIAAGGRDLGLGLPSFRNFFTSIVHSVPVATPDGVEPMRHLREVYADLYRLDAPGVGVDLRDCRREILATAWHDTIETLAAHAADRTLGYDVLNDDLVKLRSPALRRGSFGISYLGGSGALPWHLTGAAGPKGEISGDFAVWLASAGYVPVSSPLGPSGDQPWLMVPSTAVSDGELDPEFLGRLALRTR